MNLYIRVMVLFIKRIFYFNKTDPFDTCETKFIVNPLDLDVNFHMNNGRYLSIMDLGRTDLMLKAGVFWKIIKAGFYPVVASESIRFKKSLQPFQKFKLLTTIESWDEKDFFIIQQFIYKNTVVAEGYIKGRFKQWGRKGSVPTSEVFAVIGRSFESIQLSKLAEAQKSLEKMLAPEEKE